MADGAEVVALGDRIQRLKRSRAEVRRTAATSPVEELAETGRTLEEVWHLCANDEQRRQILSGQIESLLIARGSRGGRGLDRTRVSLTWQTDPTSVAPDGIAFDQVVHRPRPKPAPWITHVEAAQVVGCSLHTIRKAVVAGTIEQRRTARSYPSLSLRSVRQFATDYQARY
jgi:hypothetical protein